MEAEDVHDHEVDGSERGEVTDDFVEGIVRSLNTAVEKVTGIRIYAEVGQIRRAAIDGKVCRRRRDRSAEHAVARVVFVEAKEIEAGPGYATHGMGDFMQRAGNKHIPGKVRSDPDGTVGATGRRAKHLQLGVGDKEARMTLER